jgi:hypothetical protein
MPPAPGYTVRLSAHFIYFFSDSITVLSEKKDTKCPVKRDCLSGQIVSFFSDGPEKVAQYFTKESVKETFEVHLVCILSS